jgi:hypothetical protein
MHAGAVLAHDAARNEFNGIEAAQSPGRWISVSGTPGRAGESKVARPVTAKTENMVAVTATAPGQGGYVHYFVIEFPDGEREIQVGIELPDGRIAWSFPELGVVVSPFIESGEMQVGRHTYPVQHLYGIRPFRDEAAMMALQKDLWKRIVPLVDDATPYCALTSSGGPCLSCLGLVLRVLYPSRTGGMPELPRDFAGAVGWPYITTDDLLFYQAGLQGKRTLAERLARIQSLPVPSNLREDLVQIAHALEAGNDADPAKSRKTARKRPRPSAQKKL